MQTTTATLGVQAAEAAEAGLAAEAEPMMVIRGLEAEAEQALHS